MNNITPGQLTICIAGGIIIARVVTAWLAVMGETIANALRRW